MIEEMVYAFINAKMKRIIPIFIIIFGLSSINANNAQTIVSTLPQNRKAVIEQFNGCGYCPDAHRVVDNICAQYPASVFDIRFFQGYYAQNNLPHFVTQWGDALANQAQVYAYPSATINRHPFPWAQYTNYPYLEIGREDYASAVDTILQLTSPVNIAATVSINDSSRIMVVYVELYYTGNSNYSTNKLNVVLLQNNIIDSNISFRSYYPEMEVNDTLYRYMHVVRDMITGQWGETIETTTAGSFVTRTFVYQIPDSIGSVPIQNLCDLEVIAFVAEGQREILTGCRAVSNLADSISDSLNISVNDSTMGQVSITHCLLNGEFVLTAQPHVGYSFVMWSDSITSNPRTIAEGETTSLTAVFGIRQFYMNAISSDTNMGAVIGSGYYNYGDTVYLTAVPATNHHHFTHWNNNINDTVNPYVVVMNANKNFTAHFAIDKHNVTVSASNNLYGTATGGGEFEYGGACTIIATPYSGYRFVRWSNGTSYNPYTFAVTQDTSLTAILLPEDSVFTIVGTADPTTGTVQGSGEYAYGDTAILMAIANPGFHFDHWHDRDTINPKSVIVTNNATYIAYFVADDSEDIGAVYPEGINIFAENGRVVVEGTTADVKVFDMLGRLVYNEALPAGIYMVKVGNYPTKKIAILR